MSTGRTVQPRGKAHDYLKPLDSREFIMGESIVDELTQTEAFCRLKKIRFLGAIDYVLVRAPNQARRRYTRYQHSLGVAELARQYAELVALSYDDRRLVCVAALLHDIGHAPLSHSLERVFFEHFGIDHHHATDNIIAGRVDIGRGVYDVLKWHGLNVERLLALINGQDSSFDGFFSGPINFDTVEGILRTRRYVANTPTAPQPYAVVQAATARSDFADCRIVDGFWMQKDFVYREIINSRWGIVADLVSQVHMKRSLSKFSQSDFFSDEDKLFTKLPALRKTLTDLSLSKRITDVLDYPITYTKRSFFIDSTYKFQSRRDPLRYLQKKSNALLLPQSDPATDSAEMSRDFFDDDTV